MIGLLKTFGICLGLGFGGVAYTDIAPVEEKEVITIPVNVEMKNPHGKYELSMEDDVVTLITKPSPFYYTSYVSLNGVKLEEESETYDKYVFTLSDGENNLYIDYEVDKETLGNFATIYEEMSNGEWNKVFSLNTLISIISIVMEGGLLISVIRYFIKDKKLEDKVESTVKDTMSKVIPETTKESVLNAIEKELKPYFEKYGNEINNLADITSALAKCMVLAQDDSPSAKMAIIDALGSIAKVDNSVLKNAKSYVEDGVKKMNDTLNKLSEIQENNEKFVETIEVEKEKEEEDKEKGTMI